jgi:hypothetical protein
MDRGERQRLGEIVKRLEGQPVNIALADGSRIDDCQLISAGRPGAPTLWLYSNGADRFVPLVQVRDVWETAVVAHSPHAA